MKTLVVVANVKIPIDENEDSREQEEKLSLAVLDFLGSIGYKNIMVVAGPQRKFMSKKEKRRTNAL